MVDIRLEAMLQHNLFAKGFHVIVVQKHHTVARAANQVVVADRSAKSAAF